MKKEKEIGFTTGGRLRDSHAILPPANGTGKRTFKQVIPRKFENVFFKVFLTETGLRFDFDGS